MRKIIHVDMDAFFAAVEQRDNPALRGRPVIVGGPPDSRSVVSTCSYEARVFGVHSAMPCRKAWQLCPQAVFVAPRFVAYEIVSRQIRRIFRRYTDLVEPLSLDEAFLDVTENHPGIDSARRIAGMIRREIRAETGLTASAGVSYNKFLAKVASDLEKPDGLAEITFEAAPAFIAALPIERFFGVGRVTAERMRAAGIVDGATLLARSREDLVRSFGRSGLYFYDIARGIDERPVEPERARKSFGRETTFEQDVLDGGVLLGIVAGFVDEVTAALRGEGLAAQCVTVKVRYADFSTVTRSQHVPVAGADPATFGAVARELLGRTEAGRRPVRLVGVSLSGLVDGTDEPAQPELPFGGE